MIYYCEVHPYQNNPYFKGWSTTADTDEQAMAYFHKVHGERLVFVYDENYRTVFEKKVE